MNRLAFLALALTGLAWGLGFLLGALALHELDPAHMVLLRFIVAGIVAWLSPPMHGGFDASGRGLFFGQDEIDGSVVLVRFVITPETRNRVRFIQSYSADAGPTWEDNWIAVDERR